MKLKLVILTLLISAVGLAASAFVTVEQTTDRDYVHNSGFSLITGDMIDISKARARGEEFYTSNEKLYRQKTPGTRFWWRLYQYTDPAAEDYSFFHHDTTPYPTQTDL